MPPNHPEFPVFDQRGRIIGHVRKVRLGRKRTDYWEARSLDGCELGVCIQRSDAEWTVFEDWDAGRPRSAASIRARYRPIFETEPPVYLGNQ